MTRALQLVPLTVYLAAALGVAADGAYGPKTHAAAVAWAATP